MPSNSAPSVTEWLIVKDEPMRIPAPPRPYSADAERALREAGRTFRRVEADSAGAADRVAQGMDWFAMRRADFDKGAPMALVDARAVTRPVPAVAHQNGTDALFGDAPTTRRATRTSGPAVASEPQTDALF
ncbi:hypothetical protein [Streptomyces xantholiticus]|uniref:Uncharacterized protein n=1 Tax=Streptomyces xantholiticus TaxID=68285 RepID=A0ABV1UZY5_9ACTN